METPGLYRVKMIRNSDRDITSRVLAGEKELFELLDTPEHVAPSNPVTDFDSEGFKRAFTACQSGRY